MFSRRRSSASLPVKHRHGDARPALHPRQHLALRQRVEPGQNDTSEQRAERGDVGRVGQRLGRGFQLGAERAGARLARDGRRRRLGVGRVRRASIVRRDGAALQVVVEVVAMERRHDLVRNARGGEALGEPRGGRASRVAGVGEDGDAPDVGRPLPARHAVGGERGPDRDPEDRVRGERGLDALGDAELTVVADREQPHRTVRHRPQHLLARRRLRRSVLEQEGPVDAADRRSPSAMRGTATMPGQPRAPS